MKTLILSCLGTIAISACYADKIQPIAPIEDPPASSGINQGFSRLPRHASFDQKTGTLTIEGIMPTLKTSRNGNNSRFVIVQLRLSQDGKTLTYTSRDIFEGTSHYTNLHTWSVQTETPYVFICRGMDSERYVFMFELNPSGDLIRAVVPLYDRDNRIIGHDVLFSRGDEQEQAHPRKDYTLPSSIAR